MKIAGICGHFGFGKELSNGQTIKTKIITKELIKQLGEMEVVLVDSHNAVRRMPQLIIECLSLLKNCKNIIILPANNGLKVFVPLFTVLNKIYRRRLHYIVIGGWLNEFLEENKWLKKLLLNFDGIYVETNIMKTSLEGKGYNIKLLPNCKDLKILSPHEMELFHEEPYKLCTFSRVMLEKGIEDAINAVTKVNEQHGRVVFTLDIYGQVEDDYIERFGKLKKGFPSYIKYGGIIPYDRSVEVLKNYFILLFPTRFKTEGIPGSVIDAYSAGVPIIASEWNSFTDIVDKGRTGLGFEFGDPVGIETHLMHIANDPNKIVEMKKNCLVKAESFLPENVMRNFVEELTRWE